MLVIRIMKFKIEVEVKKEGHADSDSIWAAVERIKKKTEYNSLDELIKNLPKDVKIPIPFGSESFYGDASFIKRTEINRDKMEINSLPLYSTRGVWPEYIGKVRIIRE